MNSQGCGCLILLIVGLPLLSGNPIPPVIFLIIAVVWGTLHSIWSALFSAQAFAERERKRLLREWRSLGVSSICNGHDFEQYIADTLRRYGLKATVTPGSGDQGVDIVAVPRRGTRIASQAKLYSGNVTNIAVQEVFAGMRIHACSVGFVITNSLLASFGLALQFVGFSPSVF